MALHVREPKTAQPTVGATSLVFASAGGRAVTRQMVASPGHWQCQVVNSAGELCALVLSIPAITRLSRKPNRRRWATSALTWTY